MKKQNDLSTLFDFLQRLQAAKIHFTLHTYRDRMIMVCITVPGEKWEVEFGDNGEIEVEVFVSTADIQGAEKLEDLFKRFSD